MVPLLDRAGNTMAWADPNSGWISDQRTANTEPRRQALTGSGFKSATVAAWRTKFGCLG